MQRSSLLPLITLPSIPSKLRCCWAHKVFVGGTATVVDPTYVLSRAIFTALKAAVSCSQYDCLWCSPNDEPLLLVLISLTRVVEQKRRWSDIAHLVRGRLHACFLYRYVPSYQGFREIAVYASWCSTLTYVVSSVFCRPRTDWSIVFIHVSLIGSCQRSRD